MRHYQTQHNDERDVAMLVACNDKAVKEKLMTKLRNLGNHLHNVDVLKAGKGTLEVGYREADTKDASYYVPCPACLGRTQLCSYHSAEMLSY